VHTVRLQRAYGYAIRRLDRSSEGRHEARIEEITGHIVSGADVAVPPCVQVKYFDMGESYGLVTDRDRASDSYIDGTSDAVPEN
jgi:hypothetical protein